MSLGIPNKEQASGINKREPPATPDAPHAAKVDNILNNNAEKMLTEIPKVLTAASVITEIVIAAPFILIVAPRGIEIEYKSLSRPKRSHRAIFIGMFAAELLVKKAVIPLSLKHFSIKGYGFFLIAQNTIIGFETKYTKNIHPARRSIIFPYTVKISIPFDETALYTRPIIPNGANSIIKVTTFEMHWEASDSRTFVVSDATDFSAIPVIIAQKSIPK